MSEDRPWHPLLAGGDAEEARAAIDAVASALDDLASAGSPVLAEGAAGRALLYAYLDQAFPRAGHDERAAAFLERAVDGLTDQPLPASLYGGFVGIAWVAEHLQGAGGGDDPNHELDEALREHVGTAPWSGHYDLVSGLVGIGVYALERLPRAIAADILALVVARLDELAVARDGGITWWSRPGLMAAPTAAEFPRGYYNLGVAHGVPGVIAVLAGAAAAGIGRDRAVPLLDAAWRWMLASRLDERLDSTFPHWRADDREPRPARSAWCYGDPGAAAALYAAARCLGDPARAEVAAAIARRSVDRAMDRSGCVDAGLCHGAAGVAHIYNRFWQWTGDDVFGAAARRWFHQTLAMRRPGSGVAGFRSYQVSPGGGDGRWQDDPGLLTGATGVALALLAAISDIEPAWDRVFCISLPATPPRAP